MSQIFLQDWAADLNITKPVNESWIQAIANYYGAFEPLNGSWEQAIVDKLYRTQPINETWMQTIAFELGANLPVNENWVQAIIIPAELFTWGNLTATNWGEISPEVWG